MADRLTFEEFLCGCTLVDADPECSGWLNKEKGVILLVNKCEDDERFVLETCDHTGRRHQTGLSVIASGPSWEALVAQALSEDHYAASRQFVEELLLANH